MRFHLILASIICSFLLASCSKDSSTSPTTEKSASVAFISFEGWTSDISDSVVDIVPGKSASMDSLVLDSLSLTGDGALYVALDDDAEDPAISASPFGRFRIGDFRCGFRAFGSLKFKRCHRSNFDCALGFGKIFFKRVLPAFFVIRSGFFFCD